MKKLLIFGAALAVGVMTLVLPIAVAAGSAATSTDQAAIVTAGIPEVLGAAYQQAAGKVTALRPGCKGLRWEILAALVQVESTQAAGHDIAADGQITPPIIGPRLDGHGAGGNTTPVYDTDHGRWDGDSAYDHAVGPFQFLPSTWAGAAVNGRGNGATPDPENAYDAALTAAVYLCGIGRDLTQLQQLHDAIYAYNHSEAYVTQVESWINRFDEQATTAPIGPGGYTGKAAIVINTALAEQGIPYSWGGGGVAGPSRGVCCSKGGQDGRQVTGFDCSGLTQYAYAHVGILLPRLAADQASVGRRIPASSGLAGLRPGDLIFYAYVPGNDRSIYHVAIYLGGNQQLAAPRPGKGVEVEPVAASNYAGGAQIL